MDADGYEAVGTMLHLKAQPRRKLAGQNLAVIRLYLQAVESDGGILRRLLIHVTELAMQANVVDDVRVDAFPSHQHAGDRRRVVRADASNYCAATATGT